MSRVPTPAWGDENTAKEGGGSPAGYERDHREYGENAAMEQDTYNANEKQTVTKRDAKPGCWKRFKASVRSMWATRFTEDTDNDRELHVKTTLRELILYIVFLVLLCIVTFCMSTPTMYYYTKVMSELFLDAPFQDTGGSFRQMTTMKDFWRFAEGPLMEGLYWEKWYNGRNVSKEELGFIFYENKMLGVPRLRQLKVHHESCTIHDDFKDDIIKCYAPYALSLEDTKSFGDINGTAWNYQTAAELDGSGHLGELTHYGGGGFIQDLTMNRANSRAMIDTLKQNLWLDRGTRVVFLDFTVYNANINLFCVIRLVMEFPSTGGVIPSWSFRTVKLIRYVTALDYFVLACECIFVLYIFYYIVEEIIEIRKHRLKYLKSFWNILDIVVIFLALCCIVFNVYRTLEVSNKLDSLLDKPLDYVDFEFLSYWQIIFNSALAVMVFFAWIKVFKYISFNKTMTQLSSTLGACAKDLAGFAVMFFIIFLAFAQLGYLIFGTQVQDFSNFSSSIFTLFRIILGDFNFHELEQANRILGPAYFMLYVFFVFFVLLNMFLAIINDTYSEVKQDLANQKDEFDVADYFRKGYIRMIDKVNPNRSNKFVDIKRAIHTSDENCDNELTFDEWNNDLRHRGYAAQEIEAVFAKYDIDGDRILNAKERAMMLEDLERGDDSLQYNPDGRDSRASIRAGDLSGDESDDSERKDVKSRVGNGVALDEFTVLQRRVDRMEHSIGAIVSKIDAVLIKLEAMEMAKSKRREAMSKILDSLTEYDGEDEEKKVQMEQLVRDELDRWDSDSNGGPSPMPSAREGYKQ